MAAQQVGLKKQECQHNLNQIKIAQITLHELWWGPVLDIQLILLDSLYEFTNQRKATTKSTTQTKDETEQKIDENHATEKKNSRGVSENFKDVDGIEIEGNNKDFEKMSLKVRKS